MTNFVHQRWAILDGQVEFKLSKKQPFDMADYVALKEVTLAIEKLVTDLRPVERP